MVLLFLKIPRCGGKKKERIQGFKVSRFQGFQVSGFKKRLKRSRWRLEAI